MHSGWYQVAYSRDIREGMTEVRIDGTSIALVRTVEHGLRAVHAYCPHRGANLCRGGRLESDAIICPFHGFRVHLSSCGRFQARSLEAMEVGGLVFVKAQGGTDCGLRARLTAEAESRSIVPGFEILLAAEAELIVENAFDESHFQPVHQICNAPHFESAPVPGGGYAARGVFALPPSNWQNSVNEGHIEVPFTATAYSPTVVISDLGGDRPYAMLTASQPVERDKCVARLSLIMPHPDGAMPKRADCLYLLEQARAGLQQDAKIWEALHRPEIFDAVVSDNAVLGFRAFCRGFAPARDAG